MSHYRITSIEDLNDRTRDLVDNNPTAVRMVEWLTTGTITIDEGSRNVISYEYDDYTTLLSYRHTLARKVFSGHEVIVNNVVPLGRNGKPSATSKQHLALLRRLLLAMGYTAKRVGDGLSIIPPAETRWTAPWGVDK